MKLEIKKVSRTSPELEEIKKLKNESIYDFSFPMSFFLMNGKRKGCHFWSYEVERKFCGFSFLIEGENMVIILCFSLIKEMRNKGMGSEIMTFLKQHFKDKVFVIHTQEGDNLEFLRKNGFKNTQWDLCIKKETYRLFATTKHFSSEDYKKTIRKAFFGFFHPKLHLQV